MRSTAIILCLLALPLVVFAGCGRLVSDPSSVQPGRPSGFLQDYSRLRPCQSAPGELAYLNKSKHPTVYSMVMVDPVEIYLQDGADTSYLSSAELREIAAQLTDYLKDSLSESYKLVTHKGFGVLRVRAAITEIRPRESFWETNRSINASGVESITVETELVDSLSGTQVVALVKSESNGECGTAVYSLDAGNVDACLRSMAILAKDRLDEARGFFASSTFPQTGSTLR